VNLGSRGNLSEFRVCLVHCFLEDFVNFGYMVR